MNKPEYRLENWIFAAGRACGNVYGNPKFEEGERVTTSLILEISEGLDKIETLNSIYILGKKNGAA